VKREPARSGRGTTRGRCLSAVALVLGLVVGTAQPVLASTPKASRSCPVTLPIRTVPPGAGIGAAAFNYGSRLLRAQIWPHGTLPAGALPDGGSFASVNPDGSIRAKQGWWRGAAGTLAITGRRLDAPAAPLRADVPSGYGNRGFVPAALIFSTPGCWKVTGEAAGARLTYVVWVTRRETAR